MRMRYWILALVATCGLMLGGCGQQAPTPPPDATTDTPILDIDQGIEVSPDEVDKQTDAVPEAGVGGAPADPGSTPGGQ